MIKLNLFYHILNGFALPNEHDIYDNPNLMFHQGEHQQIIYVIHSNNFIFKL
jgi:hypothetical protein